MYNNIRRCLIASRNLHRKLLPQSIHEGILPHEVDHHTNDTYHRNNAVHTRFYCQSVSVKKTSAMLKEGIQQRLDEIVSNPEENKRYQILQLEVDVMRHNAEKVPNKIKPKDWLIILNSTSKSQRRKYLEFLWRNEKTAQNKKETKALKKAEMAKKKEEEQVEDTNEIKYGLLHNTLFLRIYDTTINFYQNARLLRTMMYEPKLVFDCGYDDHMNQREVHNCAKQLTLAFASNRFHVNPMCLYYCNMKLDGLLAEYFQINMPNLLDVDFPAFVTPQSYLDLFPKDQLVYLTPHCRTNMTKYDPNLVYIIGAIVDKVNPLPLSMAKAKKEGIRMARLPIHQYLEWGCSSNKSFTINQMLDIMLDIRHTKDWNKALKNIPTRKLKKFQDYKLQRKMEKFLHSEKRNVNVQTDFTFNSRKLT